MINRIITFVVALIAVAMMAGPASAHHNYGSPYVVPTDLPIRVQPHPTINVGDVIAPWNNAAGVTVFTQSSSNPDIVWNSTGANGMTYVSTPTGNTKACTINYGGGNVAGNGTETWLHRHEIGHCLRLADHVRTSDPAGSHLGQRFTCNDTSASTHNPYQGVMSYCRFTSAQTDWFGLADRKMLQSNGIIPFYDLRFAGIHAGAVVRMAEAGIVGGYANGSFLPTFDLKRSEMATFLTRAEGLALNGNHPFTDVSTTSTVGRQIGAIYQAGITAGCSSTLFCPDGTVTRGQMATFLMRALDLPCRNQTAANLFSDVNAGDPHACGIGAVAFAGIAEGYNDGTYRHMDSVSRMHMATFLDRAYG